MKKQIKVISKNSRPSTGVTIYRKRAIELAEKDADRSLEEITKGFTDRIKPVKEITRLEQALRKSVDDLDMDTVNLVESLSIVMEPAEESKPNVACDDDLVNTTNLGAVLAAVVGRVRRISAYVKDAEARTKL